MRSSTMWWIPGAALLFFGFMIAVFPELLALMVASAFMFIGGAYLLTGWTIQRSRRETPARVYVDRNWPW